MPSRIASSKGCTLLSHGPIERAALAIAGPGRATLLATGERLGPVDGQMWTFVHLVSAASGTAKLLGLGADRTTHALAIALAQPPFALQPGFMEPTSKLLSASTPIAIGIRAAYLAREGITGAPSILEDRRGFFRRFSYRPIIALLGDLDRFRVMETLAIKTYPGCHYFQTAFDAIATILARRRHYREDYGSDLASPREIVGLIASAVREIRRGRSAGDGVRMWFPSEVTIDLADGTRETERVDLPRGSFAGGDIDAAISEKVMREITATSGKAHAERALELGRTAEDHDLAALVAAFRVQT